MELSLFWDLMIVCTMIPQILSLLATSKFLFNALIRIFKELLTRISPQDYLRAERKRGEYPLSEHRN
jgi:hypothetical protein